MDNSSDQIAAIKAGLAALDTAISQTQFALSQATTPEDTRSLTSTLVDLRSERSRLQTQLDNLEAADVQVGGPGLDMAASAAALTISKKNLKAVHKQLDGAMDDRSMVSATLGFSKNVLTNAKKLRTMLTPS
jgi:pyruvate/oxaloacetate carboxyltransferase